jgi:predicted metal-dependent hydrolase
MQQASLFFETIEEIYSRVYRELRPRAPLPEFLVEYRPFANADSFIRREDANGRVRVRMSDLLEGAPAPIHEALAFILLSKLFGKRIPEKYNRRYRLFLGRADVRRKMLLLRQIRGRKTLQGARGQHYHLEEIFEDLNQRFFHGLLARPALSWSRQPSRTLLGHFDPAHNAIIISRIFDRPAAPRFLVEYIVFHEMLHLRYPVEHRHGKRRVHTPEFRQAERAYPRLKDARRWLRTLDGRGLE